MPDMISIAEYAERNSRTRTAVLHQIQLGRIKSAVKHKNRWLINSDEPYPEDPRPAMRKRNARFTNWGDPETRKQIRKQLRDENPHEPPFDSIKVYTFSGDYIADVTVKKRRVISRTQYAKIIEYAHSSSPDAVTESGHLIKWDPVRKFAVITDEVVERSSDHE